MKSANKKIEKLETTSRIASDIFGKSHKNVLLSIEAMKCSDEFRKLNFKDSHYISPQNKKLFCVDMTKNGFIFLCMGLTGVKAGMWRENYIKECNKINLDRH